MTKDSSFLFEIHSKIGDDTTCVVRFSDSSETMIVLDELDKIVSLHHLRKTILRIRGICQTDDGKLFFPQEVIDLPKARWVTASVAASYPIGVPVNLLLEKSGLSLGELSAYHTSKNNPTSKFLFLEGTLMCIKPDGIIWVHDLLKKDRQIEPDEAE